MKGIAKLQKQILLIERLAAESRLLRLQKHHTLYCWASGSFLESRYP